MFKRFVSITILLVSVVSCGGDEEGSSLSNSELAQDVRDISYQLGSLKIIADFDYVDGAREHLERSIEVGQGAPADKIRRVLEDGRFLLVVNQKPAKILIDAGGAISYSSNKQDELKGCRLSGVSKGAGQATHVSLGFDWSLDLSLQGEGCSQDVVKSFVEYNNDEMQNLHLAALLKLVASADRPLSETRRIVLKVRLSGRV